VSFSHRRDGLEAFYRFPCSRNKIRRRTTDAPFNELPVIGAPVLGDLISNNVASRIRARDAINVITALMQTHGTPVQSRSGNGLEMVVKQLRSRLHRCGTNTFTY